MKSQERVRSTHFDTRIQTNNGPHTVYGTVSRGWGSAIDGWALRMKGNSTLGELYIHLGIDEKSRDFKDIYTHALEEGLEPTMDFFMKLTKNSFSEGKEPLPRTTERVGAKLVLKHLLSLDKKESSPFQEPSLTRMFTVVAEKHVHSLQANEFLIAQNRTLGNLALSA